jgi:hypothetical protein
MNSSVSLGSGTTCKAQFTPPATAVDVALGTLLVSDSTTWRLRRTASASALRAAFCSASATVRTWVFFNQVTNDGTASLSSTATSVTVTMSSISVKPLDLWREGGSISTPCPS